MTISPFQKYIVLHGYYEHIHVASTKHFPYFPQISQYVSTLFPNTESFVDPFLHCLNIVDENVYTME